MSIWTRRVRARPQQLNSDAQKQNTEHRKKRGGETGTTPRRSVLPRGRSFRSRTRNSKDRKRKTENPPERRRSVVLPRGRSCRSWTRGASTCRRSRGSRGRPRRADRTTTREASRRRARARARARATVRDEPPRARTRVTVRDDGCRSLLLAVPTRVIYPTRTHEAPHEPPRPLTPPKRIHHTTHDTQKPHHTTHDTPRAQTLTHDDDDDDDARRGLVRMVRKQPRRGSRPRSFL